MNNINQYLEKILDDKNREIINNAAKVLTVWEKVLEKIKSPVNPNEGRKLIEHTRIIELKNKILIVEVDHPGWIELLNLHKKFILKGIKMNLPDVEIETMAYTLKGNKAEYIDNRTPEEKQKDVIAETKKRLLREEQNNKNNVYDKNEIKGNKTLPEELVKVFKEIENSMLTNSSNKC